MKTNRKEMIIIYIISILTLIFAFLGATLAYFNATVKGKDDAVKAHSGTVSISYTDKQVFSATSIIPATEKVATTSYLYDFDNKDTTKSCYDSNNNEVCSVYHFEVMNNGGEAYITGRFTITENEFTNLKYVVYDVTSGIPVKISEVMDLKGNAGDNVSIFGLNNVNGNISYKSTLIDSNMVKKYEVLIFLLDNGLQDEERNKGFTATAYIDIVGYDTDHIAGVIK